MNYQKTIWCILVLLVISSCKKKENEPDPYPAYFLFSEAGKQTTTLGMAQYLGDRESLIVQNVVATPKSNTRQTIFYYLNLKIKSYDIINQIKVAQTTDTGYQHIGNIKLGLNKVGMTSGIARYNPANNTTFLNAWYISYTMGGTVFGGQEFQNFEIKKLVEVGNGFLAIGVKKNGFDDNIEIIRLSPSLTVLWQKEFGGKSIDVPVDALRLCDGNYGILAYTYSKGAGDRDIWYLKIDANGNVITENTYGGTGYDDPVQMEGSSGCNIYIAGSSNSFGAAEHDGYLLCINEKGDKIWEKTYGTPQQDGFTTLSLLPSGNGIVAAGNSAQGIGQPDDIFVVAINISGNEMWRKKYGDANLAEKTKQVLTDDKFYYLATSRFDAQANSDAVFIKDKLNP